MVNHVPAHTATKALRSLFGDGAQETLTLEEVFLKAGRDMTKATQNTRWLQSKLTDLRYYGLVRSVYSSMYRRRLQAITLTERGKFELSRMPASNYSNNRGVTLDSLAESIRWFRRQNPTIEVHFSVHI